MTLPPFSPVFYSILNDKILLYVFVLYGRVNLKNCDSEAWYMTAYEETYCSAYIK